MQAHARELLSAEFLQISLKIIAIEFRSAEYQCPVHFMFLDSANAVLSLQYLYSFRQRAYKTSVIVRSYRSRYCYRRRMELLSNDYDNYMQYHLFYSSRLLRVRCQFLYNFSSYAMFCPSADLPLLRYDVRFRAPRPRLSSLPKLENASNVPAIKVKIRMFYTFAYLSITRLY